MDQLNLNIDIKKILENKSLLLVVIVVIASIVAASTIFGNYSSKITKYQVQVKEKLERDKVITRFEESKAELAKVMSSVAKPLSADELSNQVTDYAVQNHIEITDISFRDTQNFDDYTSVGIHMTLKVKDFKDVVDFIDELEKSPYLLKVEYWAGKMDDSGVMNCEINIISTQIKT